MGIALSTAGVVVSYGVEATAGSKPTSWTTIPDIKEVPEMNPEPETLETTTLAETEYKTYIAGLKDLGGSLAFVANFTNELHTVWDKLVSDYEKGIGESKNTWFKITHPTLEKELVFKGQPSAMGLPSMSVNSVLEVSLYVTPTNEPSWEAKAV